MTSVRTIPYAVSVSSSTASADEGAENAGQPHPESYFVSDVNSSAPQPAQWYVPGSKTWSYSPENGASVPFWRRIRYCSASSSARHSASVFWIFGNWLLSVPILLRPLSLASAVNVTAPP